MNEIFVTVGRSNPSDIGVATIELWLSHTLTCSIIHKMLKMFPQTNILIAEVNFTGEESVERGRRVVSPQLPPDRNSFLEEEIWQQ